MLLKLTFSVIIALIAVYTTYNYEQIEMYVKILLRFDTKLRSNEVLFTSENVAQFNGLKRPELYLIILGKVYDVTKGKHLYESGKEYNTFIGRDNSQAFITGNFKHEDASDDVIKFSNQELKQLFDWTKFYEKDYKFIGKLIGRFYDKHGDLTNYAKVVYQRIKDAQNAIISEEMEKQKYPPCNVEWDPNTGTRFWCTNKSGGIKRNWVGVPRQLYDIGSSSYRCACMHEDDLLLGNIKEYENCEPNSDTCIVVNT